MPLEPMPKALNKRIMNLAQAIVDECSCTEVGSRSYVEEKAQAILDLVKK